jgi:hypothetical protein
VWFPGHYLGDGGRGGRSLPCPGFTNRLKHWFANGFGNDGGLPCQLGQSLGWSISLAGFVLIARGWSHICRRLDLIGNLKHLAASLLQYLH